MFIADGLPGKEEEIRQLYPRADFQLCTIHASRNFGSHVRVRDRKRSIQISREDAVDQFNAFKSKWSSMCPKLVYNMERNLGILLKYHDYPEPIRRSIHSTNLID